MASIEKVSTYRFKKFDFKRIRYDATIVVFGQRGSGKSTWWKNLRMHNSNPSVKVICESPDIDSKYPNIHKKDREGAFDEDALRKLLQDQNKISKKVNNDFREYKEKMCRELELKQKQEWECIRKKLLEKAAEEDWSIASIAKQLESKKKTTEIKWAREKDDVKQKMKKVYDDLRKPHSFDLCIDDCSAYSSVMKSKLMCCLLNNARHFMMRATTLVQYMIDYPARLRAGADWVVIFRDNVPENIKRYYKYWASIFNSVEEFKQVLDVMCQNHGCMVIDMRSGSANLEDRVFVCHPQEMDEDTTKVCQEKDTVKACQEIVTENDEEDSDYEDVLNADEEYKDEEKVDSTEVTTIADRLESLSKHESVLQRLGELEAKVEALERIVG